MSVIIIESPNKVKKIKEYSGMEVYATVGHFMELKEIDTQNSYTPKFDYMQDKKKNIFYYIERCKGKVVYIATDPDREGYAIGKMFFDKIKNVAQAVYRAEFHEITKSGIEKGLNNATLFANTNFNYYNSFLARRIGDRLIGYTLSPYLSKSLSQKALSAGRVQTPALSLIVERDREIKEFNSLPEDQKVNYQIQAKLKNNNGVILIKHIQDGKEVKYDDLASAEEVFNGIKDCQNALISNIKISEEQKAPPKPFITSTLLKEGSKKLGIGTQKIQQLAQNLFEAGLITYIRTDAETLSQEFLDEAEQFFKPIYGENYQRREYKAKNSQAEAHEAIRITHCHRFEEINQVLAQENITDPLAKSLYELIFKNTIASQAKNAVYEKREILFKVRMLDFKCTAKTLTDKGFLGLFNEEKQEEKETEETINLSLSHLQENTTLEIAELFIAQLKKTAPQPYKEADFIAILEKKGIGRPSTYASYLPLLLNREYIEISNDKSRTILPTHKGVGVINFFKQDSNAWILDLDFTKTMEEKLDLIVNGECQYLAFMEEIAKKLPSIANTESNEERKIYPPSDKQIKFVEEIAQKLQVELPQHYKENVSVCKSFIDKHIQALNSAKTSTPKAPSEKQIAFAEKLSQEKGIPLPNNYKNSMEICKNFIDQALKK